LGFSHGKLAGEEFVAGDAFDFRNWCGLNGDDLALHLPEAHLIIDKVETRRIIEFNHEAQVRKICV
jgi:hypothetical protein